MKVFVSISALMLSFLLSTEAYCQSCPGYFRPALSVAVQGLNAHQLQRLTLELKKNGQKMDLQTQTQMGNSPDRSAVQDRFYQTTDGKPGVFTLRVMKKNKELMKKDIKVPADSDGCHPVNQKFVVLCTSKGKGIKSCKERDI